MSQTHDWIAAAVEGWPGKIVSLVAGGVAGMFLSRAKIMDAVTNRVNSLLGHMEQEIQRLSGESQAHREAHARCEEDLTAMRLEIAELMAQPVAAYVNPTAPPPRPKRRRRTASRAQRRVLPKA